MTESEPGLSLAGRKLVFVVNHVAFFVSHRLPIAQAALNTGCSVGLVTGQAGSPVMEEFAMRALKTTDVKHERVFFKSSGMNPFVELLGLIQLVLILRRLRPDVVHCVSPKGILYGGLAARLVGVRSLVLSVSGMGFAFTPTGNASAIRLFIASIYRTLAKLAYGHSHKKVIIQNLDDQGFVVRADLAKPNEVVLIPGSGVELNRYIDAKIEEKQPIILFPARMLIDKGVFEFVEAARVLQGQLGSWRFVLAGAADYSNPSSVALKQIEQWQAEGIVDWVGHVSDLAPLYAQTSIVCLPSYREGMPKALLEAAAAGCAVITTDVTGCREAVVPGETGDLVPVRNGGALAHALLSLMNDRGRRERYGYAGRALAIERYSIGAVVESTLKIYKELLVNA